MPSTKILVVEDEQLIADDLKATLESMGYEVFPPIASGEGALVQMMVLKPDLVLMDIYLSGEMDGIEVSKQIQSVFDVPVVFLTANTDSATLERVKAIHPFGYVMKPYDEKILDTTIAIALSRHQAEVETRKALATVETHWAEAKAHNRRKSEYLALTAHEFRNSLVAIQFAAEILQDHGEQLPKPKQQQQFQRIQLATQMLNEMLDQLLLLEQVEEGALSCHSTSLDVVGFCRDAVEAWQLTTNHSHILTFTTAVEHCVATLDSQLLGQLLDLLLSNAIKYSPLGGSVELALMSTPEQITLQIQDTGIGIPPDEQPQIFQAFYRASNAGEFSGSGLGLTVAHQCVTLQGGQISVESTLGKGTTVFVALPR